MMIDITEAKIGRSMKKRDTGSPHFCSTGSPSPAGTGTGRDVGDTGAGRGVSLVAVAVGAADGPRPAASILSGRSDRVPSTKVLAQRNSGDFQIRASPSQSIT